MEKANLENKKFDFEKARKNFSEYLTDAQVEKIEMKDVPSDALKFFERMSSQFVEDKDYKPENFENLFLIRYQNGDQVYVAQQTKKYDTNGDTERLTYFWEIRDGKNIGHGELRYNIDPIAVDTP